MGLQGGGANERDEGLGGALGGMGWRGRGAQGRAEGTSGCVLTHHDSFTTPVLFLGRCSIRSVGTMCRVGWGRVVKRLRRSFQNCVLFKGKDFGGLFCSQTTEIQKKKKTLVLEHGSSGESHKKKEKMEILSS